jgi:hypothetical protein
MRSISTTPICVVLAVLTASAGRAQDADLDAAIRGLTSFEVGGSRVSLRAIELVVAGADGPEARRDVENKLLDVLFDAACSKAARQFAASQLELVVSDSAIPRLVASFSDKVVGVLAANVLVRIPSETAAEAIRASVAEATLAVQRSLVSELGRRRDVRAVPLLQPFLARRDFDLFRAAARALGDIQTIKAERALRSALRGSLALRRQEFAFALMRHAAAKLRRGKAPAAAAIYQQFTPRTEVRAVRLIAYVGFARAVGAGALPLLLIAMVDPDDKIADLAAQEIARLKNLVLDQRTTNQIVGAARRGQSRIILIHGFIRRGKADALGFIRTVLRARGGRGAGDRAGEREAALQGIVALQGARAIPELIRQLVGGDRHDVRAVQSLLVDMPGVRADYEIARHLHSGSLRPTVRLALVGAFGQRRSHTAASSLVVVVERDAVFGVRLAALRALADYSGQLELDGAVELLVSRTTRQERLVAATLVARLARSASGKALPVLREKLQADATRDSAAVGIIAIIEARKDRAGTAEYLQSVLDVVRDPDVRRRVQALAKK